MFYSFCCSFLIAHECFYNHPIITVQWNSVGMRWGTCHQCEVLRSVDLWAHYLFFCRNYHVFYYLLAGASEQERESLNLSQPQDFFYLNQVRKYSTGKIAVFLVAPARAERLNISRTCSSRATYLLNAVSVGMCVCVCLLVCMYVCLWTVTIWFQIFTPDGLHS